MTPESKNDVWPRWCYRSHSFPYAGFQVLNVVDLNLVDNVLHINPTRKNPVGLNLPTKEAKRLVLLCRSISQPSLSLGDFQQGGRNVAAPRLVGGQFEVVIGEAHTALACPSTNIRAQSFPKIKTVQSSCRTLSGPTRSLLGCLSPIDMWHMDLTVTNPAVVPVYNSIGMERSLAREAHFAEEIG
jgi:hypothetical protein